MGSCIEEALQRPELVGSGGGTLTDTWQGSPTGNDQDGGGPGIMSNLGGMLAAPQAED